MFETESGVMCLDIHPEYQYLIAVGFYSGEWVLSFSFLEFLQQLCISWWGLEVQMRIFAKWWRHTLELYLYLTRTYMVTFGLLMQWCAKAAYAIISARKLSLNLNVIQQGYLLSKQQNRESVIKSHALWTSSSLISCLSSDLKSYGRQINWLKTTPDFHQLGLWWTLTL